MYQVIGVHTGFDKGYNLGTFIKSISYDSFSKIFSQDDINQPNQSNSFD